MRGTILKTALFTLLLTVMVSANDIRLVIGRAAETNNIQERTTAWYSAIVDAYLHLRIIGMKGVDAIPSDSLAEYYSFKGKYGLSHTRGQLNKAAVDFNASHIMKVDYIHNDREESVMLNIKIYAKDASEPILDHSTRFPVISTATYLDEAIIKIAEAVGKPVEDNYRSKLLTPILVPEMNLVKELGETAVIISEEKETKYLEKAFATLDEIITERQNFWLAYFVAGELFEKHKKYEEAAETYDKLLNRRQFKWPELFIRAARNFRRAELLPSAEATLATAKKYKVETFSYKLEYAKLKAAQSNYNEAIKAFLAVLEDAPDNEDALLYLAVRNNIDKDYTKALPRLEKLIALKKYEPEAYLEQGKAYIGLKNKTNAIAALKAAIPFRGDRSEAHILLAELYSKDKKFDTAAYHYTEALKERHDDAELLITTTHTYRAGKDDQGALEVLQNYGSAFPGNLLIEKELGLVYFAVKDTIRARKSLEKCIPLDPPSKEVFLTLSKIYTDAEEWANVIMVNEKALPLVKNKTDIHFAIGRGYFKVNKYPQSETALKNVIAKSPTYPMANWYLGEILYSRQEFKNALVYYNREKTKNKNTIPMQERIVSANFKLKQYVTARREANELIKLQAKSGFAYTHLALISLAEKKYPEAQKHVKQAALYGKVDPVIYKDLGYGFAEAKLWNDAINSFNSYLSVNTSDDTVYLKIAEVYTIAKRPEDAVQSYVIANELDKVKNNHALAEAGHVLFNQKLADRAEKMYSEYLTAGGTNSLALQNYAQLMYNKGNYSEAVISIDKITDERKTNPTVTKIYGQSKYHLKQYAVALPFLTKSVQLDSENIELAEMCAISYEKTDAPAKAVPYLITIVMKGNKEQQKEYGYHLAQVYEKLKQTDKAMAQYRKNISRFPKDYRNHEALAGYYIDQKQYSATIKLLAAPAVAAGAPASLSKPLAIAYKNVQNNGKASVAYERYLAKNPNDSTSWNELGDIYYVQKKYSKAVTPYTKAIAMMPKHKWAHYRLANSYVKINKPAEAQTTLMKVWPSTFPEDKDILNLLTKVVESTKDTSLTIQVFTQRAKLEPKNFELNVDLGDLLFAKQRIDEGAQAYERALVIKNTSYPVRKRLIEYYIEKKNEERAFALISEGLRFFPKISELYLFRAEYFLRTKDLQKAKLDLQKTVQLNPNNDYAFFTLGMLHKQIKELKSAKTALTSAVNIDQKNSEYRLQLARVLVDLNQLKGAMAQGEALLKLEPKDVSIVSEVGTYFHEAGKVDRAEELYIAALAIDENCSICYQNLGIIYYEQVKYDLAEVNLDKLMNMDTSDFTANLYLGDIKRGNGHRKEALKLYSRALKLNPESDETVFKTVNAALEDEKMNIAVQTLATWKKAKTEWIFTAEGRIQEAKAKPTKAKSLYDMAVKSGKNSAFAHIGLGRIRKDNNDLPGAREEFGKAIGIDPTNVESYILMANAYFLEKMYVSARELLSEAKKINAKNPDVYYYLAMVHSRERNHDDAVAVLKQGLKVNPQSARIHFALANEMLEAIKPHEAIKQFEHVLANDPREEIAIKTYKSMGDIYYEQLLDNKNAKKYYKKYLRAGGKDKTVKQKLSTL